MLVWSSGFNMLQVHLRTRGLQGMYMSKSLEREHGTHLETKIYVHHKAKCQISAWARSHWILFQIQASVNKRTILSPPHEKSQGYKTTSATFQNWKSNSRALQKSFAPAQDGSRRSLHHRDSNLCAHAVCWREQWGGWRTSLRTRGREK